MSDFIYSGPPDECGYHVLPYNEEGLCDSCIEEDRVKTENLLSFARLMVFAPSNPSNDILRNAAFNLLKQEAASQK